VIVGAPLKQQGVSGSIQLPTGSVMMVVQFTLALQKQDKRAWFLCGWLRLRLQNASFLNLPSNTVSPMMQMAVSEARHCLSKCGVPAAMLATFAITMMMGVANTRAQEPVELTQNILVNRKHQLGYLVVTPHGPKDGGDFGPHTPGTKTSGLQEAFQKAKETTQDVFIAGGNLTFDKNQGVVYFLHETLQIPWMQDFRLDGGEYVIQYTPRHGDAIVMDSQMSCHYKFGILASNSDAAVLRLQPASVGPDRFQVFTTTNIHINALVGGGGSWMGGEAFSNELKKDHAWTGTGLWLDASKGSLNDNRITVMEVVGCHTSLLLTGRCSNNWVSVPFLHLSRIHVQLGTASDHAYVTNNRIRAAMDGQGISESVGARIFGSGNLLELSTAQTSPGNDVVFEAPSRDNLVITSRLLNGITNRSHRPTNRIITARAAGLAVTTPPFPPSGETITNRQCTNIEIMVVQPGRVSSWTLGDAEDTWQQFDGGLRTGQCIRLAPGESVRFDYMDTPQWRWRSTP